MSQHHGAGNLLAFIQHCLDVDHVCVDRFRQLALSWLASLRMQRGLPVLLSASLGSLDRQMVIVIVSAELLLFHVGVRVESALSCASTPLLLATI